MASASLDIAHGPSTGALLLAALAVLGAVARQRPRQAGVDAMLIALAASLLVNDSPTKVAGFGAALAAAVRALGVCADRAGGRESRE